MPRVHQALIRLSQATRAPGPSKLRKAENEMPRIRRPLQEKHPLQCVTIAPSLHLQAQEKYGSRSRNETAHITDLSTQAPIAPERQPRITLKRR